MNQAARDEATAALEQLHEADYEIKSLRTMTQRMILTQEEMVCIQFIDHTDIFSSYSSLVMVVLTVNCYLRKRLFLKGVGSLGIGVYVFDMVNSLNF